MVKTRNIQHLNNDPKNKIPTLKVEAGAQKGKLKKIKKTSVKITWIWHLSISEVFHEQDTERPNV